MGLRFGWMVALPVGQPSNGGHSHAEDAENAEGVPMLGRVLVGGGLPVRKGVGQCHRPWSGVPEPSAMSDRKPHREMRS